MSDAPGLSNSMMGGGFGGHVGAAAPSISTGGASFGNKNHDTVYGIIKANNDDQGINTANILAQVDIIRRGLVKKKKAWSSSAIKSCTFY